MCKTSYMQMLPTRLYTLIQGQHVFMRQVNAAMKPSRTVPPVALS